MNKKIFTKKLKKYRNNLRGGGLDNKKLLSSEIQKSVNDTYNFFEQDIKPLLNEAYAKGKIPFTIDETLKIDLTKLSDNILGKVKEDNDIEYSKYDFENYNLVYLDSHGSHNNENQLEECPENIYICLMSNYNYYARIVNDFMNSVEQFLKYLNIDEFKDICYFKSAIHDINKYNKFVQMGVENSFYTYHEECFFKAQWIYPKQYFYDLNLESDYQIGENMCLYTYISEFINGDIKKTKIITNEFLPEKLNSLSQYVNFISKKYPNKKHIILLSPCRVDKSTQERSFQIPESYYLNNIYNKCLQNIIINNLKEKVDKSNIPRFLCVNDLLDRFESEFVSLDFKRNHEIKIVENDNLHPNIPKLKDIYDKLLTLNTPYKKSVKEYLFENTNDELIFLVNLTPKKLKKFLYKLYLKNSKLCKEFTQLLKNNYLYLFELEKYTKNLKKFFDVFRDKNDKNPIIYHNYSVQNLILDLFQISHFLNIKVPKNDILTFQKIFPNSGIFDNQENEIYKEISTKKFNTNKIILNNFNSLNNPFYDLTVERNKKYYEKITEIETTKCRVPYKLYFSDFPKKMKLRKVHIDNTIFSLKNNKNEIEELFQRLDDTFNKKELIIYKIEKIPENYILNIKNFKIFKLHFGIVLDNKFIIQEINLESEIENLEISGHKYINNIDLGNKKIVLLKIVNDFSFKKIESGRKDIFYDKKIISNYSNIKNIHIENINFKEEQEKIYLFNQVQFNEIKELKLINLENININETKIECKKIEKLIIKNCNIKNFNINFKNVSYLEISNTNIVNKVNIDVELKKNKDLEIILSKNQFTNFNIYVNIKKLKQSKLKIIKNNLNIKEKRKGNYYNLLSLKLSNEKRIISRSNEVNIDDGTDILNL